MTETEKTWHAAKVKKVMIDHLTALGWPKLTDEQIMTQLKPMWVKLEEAGLIVEGMDFNAYQAIANNAYMMKQVQDIMGI